VTEPLLDVRGLTKHFPVTSGVFGRVVGQVRAVDDVSFELSPGETLGLVGESGSGKTTAGRAILRLIEPTAGQVTFDGTDVTRADANTLRHLRRSMQIVFQDPYSSLNPRLRVLDIVGEALEVHGLTSGAETERRVAALLARVGLSPSALNRYPHEFSGGQRQRIGVARAIALEPKLVVLDEPVSALDVSIQAQVVNLLLELRREMGLAYLFIAHDLSVVRHLSHRIAVMYLGELVEVAPRDRLFSAPAHPYTRALLSAIPVPDPKRRRQRIVLTGDVPSPLNPPSGCRFHTRCPAVMDRCRVESPPAEEVEQGHAVRCFHAEGERGDDWYRRVSERIERQVAENAAESPAPKPLALPDDVGAPAEHHVAATPRRPLPKPVRWLLARPRRRRLALAAALLASFIAGGAFGRASREREALAEIKLLRAEIQEYERVTGSLPATLSDLGWRLPPIFGGLEATDPWGRPIVYRVRASRKVDPAILEPDRFLVLSLGRDGVPSRDDLGWGGR